MEVPFEKYEPIQKLLDPLYPYSHLLKHKKKFGLEITKKLLADLLNLLSKSSKIFQRKISFKKVELIHKMLDSPYPSSHSFKNKKGFELKTAKKMLICRISWQDLQNVSKFLFSKRRTNA